MINLKRFDLQCGDGNGLYKTPSTEGEYMLAADVDALLASIGNRPDITIQQCTFSGLNLDGTQPFEFEPVGDNSMRCKSINMRGWLCIGPAGNNLITRLQNQVDALKELVALHTKIMGAGTPPHTDYWHQSLYAAEKKVADSNASLIQAQSVELLL